MSDPVINEMRDLLQEIRDLLVPVADAYRDEYQAREAKREEQRREAISSLLSTAKRTSAWALADGTRSQREIAKQSGMDEGGASRFFRTLRELGAIDDTPNPTRTVEVNQR